MRSLKIQALAAFALAAVALAASAQDFGGFDLGVGQKTEVDGDSFQLNTMSPDEIANNNVVMNTMSNYMQQGVTLAQSIQTLIDQGVSIETAVTAAKQLNIPGADPQQVTAAIATALSNRGQTPAQVTAVLVETGSSPTQATVAVRVAVPTASNGQLTQGLAAAGVTGNEAQVAVRAAPAPAPAPQTQTSGSAASITGSGLIVGNDGRAVVVASEVDQLKAVLAFVAQAARNDPNALRSTQVQNGISTIIGNALSAGTGGTVDSTNAAQQVLTALAQGGGTGGNAASVLTSALDKAIIVLQTQTGTVINVPGSGSPS